MVSRFPSRIAVIGAALLFASDTFADEPAKLTEEERAVLQADAKRLWTEARRLDKERKVKEAVVVGEQMLAVDRRLLGDDHKDIAFDLEWLAARYEVLEDFEGARPLRSEALKNKINRLGADHWQVSSGTQPRQ